MYDLYNTIIMHVYNCFCPFPSPSHTRTKPPPPTPKVRVKIYRYFFHDRCAPYFFRGFCRCFHPLPPPYYEIIIITLLYPYQLSTHGRSAKEPRALPTGQQYTLNVCCKSYFVKTSPPNTAKNVLNAQTSACTRVGNNAAIVCTTRLQIIFSALYRGK